MDDQRRYCVASFLCSNFKRDFFFFEAELLLQNVITSIKHLVNFSKKSGLHPDSFFCY